MVVFVLPHTLAIHLTKHMLGLSNFHLIIKWFYDDFLCVDNYPVFKIYKLRCIANNSIPYLAN